MKIDIGGIINRLGKKDAPEPVKEQNESVPENFIAEAVKKEPGRTFHSFDLKQTGTYLWVVDVYEWNDIEIKKIYSTPPDVQEVCLGKIVSFYELKDCFWKDRVVV